MIKEMDIIDEAFRSAIGQNFTKEYLERTARARAEGKAEGKAEGEAKGEAKGMAELIVSLLESKSLPVPEDIKSELYSMQDTKILRQLFNDALHVDSLPQFIQHLPKG